MSRTIAILTENFPVAWQPTDLDDFLAGCQECTVQLAEAFQRAGHSVTVFLHGPTTATECTYHEVKYLDSDAFQPTFDVVILFKINPLATADTLTRQKLRAANVIYWSSDVEQKFNDQIIRRAVCLTDFHRQRNFWPWATIIPHGIDKKSLQSHRIPRERNTILYCSSPDRGLQQLLLDWQKIQRHFPEMRLFITYGFKISRQLSTNPRHVQLQNMSEQSLIAACRSLTNVYYLGHLNRMEMEKMYWRCQYWILPLNNADSELFCLNAIKSQYCGCIPIVNKIGALQETVGNHIPYTEFVQGRLNIVEGQTVDILDWDQVAQRWAEIL